MNASLYSVVHLCSAVTDLWSGPGEGMQCLAFSVVMAHFIAENDSSPG